MYQHKFMHHVATADFALCYGRVKKTGLTHVEADGPNCAIGDICEIELGRELGNRRLMAAEVVAVEEGRVKLIPLEPGLSIPLGARVIGGTDLHAKIGVGAAFSGRAINALGNPIDGRGGIAHERLRPIALANPGPLERTTWDERMDTGIRAIDAIMPLAKGQRTGIFAAAGVGKTSLVEQLSAQVDCDRCVICLIGERGREVEALWQACRRSENPDLFTMVASTSDESAALRVRAAHYALALADHWRAKGEHVLLVMDSVTRLAMAMREIGLAAGEPPTVRAYTPSVFSAIPQFVEHCGALKSGGAISAIMTVLAETDDIDDPIVEMMKSLLDGHIILSRQLAEQGHFPAIDVTASVSRLASRLMTAKQAAAAGNIRRQLSLYEESKTMVESGVYRRGTNAALDEALDKRPAILDFLKQAAYEAAGYEDMAQRLDEILSQERSDA